MTHEARKYVLVTPHGPDEKNGGAMAYRRIAAAVAPNVRLHIIQAASLDVPSKTNCTVSSHEETLLTHRAWMDYTSRILLKATYLWFHKRRIRAICRDAHTVIFHNSRLGSLLSYVKRSASSAVRFVVACDNVEQDIVRTVFAERTLRGRIQEAIDLMNVRAAESAASKLADQFLFVARSDQVRYHECYGRRSENDSVVPISANRFGTASLTEGGESLPAAVVQIVILFVGYLGYKPNQDAAARLIEMQSGLTRYLCPLGYEPHVVVAGGGPPKWLTRLAELAGVRLRVNPTNSELARFYQSADVVAVPVTSGGGMKTKVAEALAYGVPIVATREALVGYEAVNGADGIEVADPANPTEFAAAVAKLARIMTTEGTRVRQALAEYWLLYYSPSAISAQMRSALGVEDRSI